MADTMTGTIAAAMTECEAAAREQGWEGDWHPLPADLEYAADQTKATHGRYPTVAEWEDAGYKVFPNGAYCADETTTAAVVLGRRGGARATEAQKAAARRNAPQGGRPPREPYRLLAWGAPYGDGELLQECRTIAEAHRAATSTLHPGQRAKLQRGDKTIAAWVYSYDHRRAVRVTVTE